MVSKKTTPKTTKRSSVNEEILSEMREDTSQNATPDQLSNIRTLIAELRDLELENADISDKMRKNSERIRVLKEKELVDVMDTARVDRMGVMADGNKPPFYVEIVPYYHANIAKDWDPERRAKSFAWVDKHHPDMLRNTFNIGFGKGSRAQQKKLESFLKKEKIKYSNEFGVPWNTLTAFVREQIEDYKKTPPLDLLGATVGRVAKVVKEKK